MTAAIEVSDVWKKFRRGERLDSLRDLLPFLARAAVSSELRHSLRDSEFWAVREVSFQVQPGEVLGIVGPNGAGKSTVLKLLTGILRPTRGRVEVRGRVGALIEIAAAFHPDLTGRENVYLQGAILGMRHAEVTRRLDEIVDFAGVREFIDTPVKRYSSGMHARLGFAVAAHLNPDVLLIDEVLSVGDMAFQQKCIDRMMEFKRQGVAMAFVSHNLQAVASLCDRVLYLDREVRAAGPPQTVIEAYVGAVHRMAGGEDSGGVAIAAAGLVDERGERVGSSAPNALLKLPVTYQASQPLADLTLGFIVHRSADGLVVYDGNVRGTEIGLERLLPGERVTVDFCFRAHLTRGQYHVECHVLHNPTRRFLARLRPAAMLTIEEPRSYAGVADLELRAVLAHPPGSSA